MTPFQLRLLNWFGIPLLPPLLGKTLGCEAPAKNDPFPFERFQGGLRLGNGDRQAKREGGGADTALVREGGDGEAGGFQVIDEAGPTVAGGGRGHGGS